ncbi:hypothetical protein Hte_002319 [Hypoxylon texense]
MKYGHFDFDGSTDAYEIGRREQKFNLRSIPLTAHNNERQSGLDPNAKASGFSFSFADGHLKKARVAAMVEGIQEAVETEKLL